MTHFIQPAGTHEARVLLEKMGIKPARGMNEVRFALLKASARITELEAEIATLQKEKDNLTIQNEELRSLSETDPLTGLSNRRGFFNDFKQVLARRDRSSKKKTYPKAALLFIDFNDFKSVNDRYGHIGGDNAIKHITNVLKNNLRPGDDIARIGGDEFAIILYDTSEDEAKQAGVRLSQAVLDAPLTFTEKNSQLFKREETSHFSISFGIYKLLRMAEVEKKNVNYPDVINDILGSVNSSMKAAKGASKVYAQYYLDATRDGRNPLPFEAIEAIYALLQQGETAPRQYKDLDLPDREADEKDKALSPQQLQSIY